MNKKYKSKKSKFRSIAFGITTVALSCIIGMTTACDTDDDDDETEKTTTKQDTQLLKNGNFEFFDDNDGIYYISSPDNWTGSSNGTSSDSMSGVIKTDYSSWKAFTDTTLPTTLEENDDLDDDDDDKVDYNGMEQDDLPYKDTHRATKSDAAADNNDLDYIDNPYTHSYKWDDDGNLIDNDGNVVKTYTDDDGKYYFDEDLSNPVETSVLMIHNYDEDTNYGTEYYYSSSTTLTLEANTAAKISVWVKTVDLYFAGSTGDRTPVSDSMGAYIKVAQTVGGTSLDSFYIKNINTETITDGTTDSNNGWVQYNIYVQACDYAETTLTLSLGLGENSRYLCEGYAFFDDITYTKYMNADDMKADNGGEATFDALVKDTTCDLGSSADEMKFRTDKVTIQTEQKDPVELDYYNGKYDFYINLNLADAASTNPFTFGSDTVEMGFTVDSDNYVSSKGELHITNAGQIENKIAYVPKDLSTNGKDTNDDVLANVTITNAGITNASSIFGGYASTISSALSGAVNLPGANESQSALVILSTQGAAYQSNISNSSLFTLSTKDGNESYKVVSFWVKTADMKGDTAATITVRDKNDTSNSSSFTIDSTTISQTDITATDISADENTQVKHSDVYDGWVQCFVLVSNTLEDNESEFEILVNFGNTTIKDTTNSSYRPGWLAITNMIVIDVDDTAYGYISSSNSATLSFSESTTTASTVFDTEYGDNGDIDKEIVRPANYNGYNGTSAIVTVGGQTNDDINQKNKNVYAGLINKDGILNYDLGSSLNALMQQYVTDEDADSAWNLLTQGNANATINHTVQPLLIVNTVRQLADETAKYYSYGYVGSSSTVSESSYQAVSVKVFASEGAIARVYLIDPDTKKTLNFDFPTYTFWYDDDGNVLRSEPDEDADTATQKANIAYTLASNGLYTDADGNYYANIYNLTKEYYNESVTYYDADGNTYIYEELKDGVTYYTDANKTNYAPHYLVTDDGDRVYSYISGTDGNATYNYLVENVVDTDVVVHGFDTSVATPRYKGADQSVNTDYMFTIDTTTEEGKKLANKWITVNFYIYTGNQSKTYRLELWSGARDSLELVNSDGTTPTSDSYVLFDYSYTSLDEDAYNNLRDYYTDNIIADYKENITAADNSTEYNSNEENLTYYETLVGAKSSKYNYVAKYYTYTLYDSTEYQPFNEDTAEDDETGYVYTYSDYDESLAFLKIDDTSAKVSPSMTMFIDYSTVSQEITVGTASDVEDDDDDDEDTSNTNIWLLASSICLVVALIIAILAILIKDLIKKHNRRKTAGKNSYNYNKNKRYVKKYTKANGDILADNANSATPADNAAVDNDTSADTTADNSTVADTSVTDTPAAPAEEAPATVTPATEELEVPSEPKSDDNN